MQADFRVESRSYDGVLRGTWRACRLSPEVQLSDPPTASPGADCLRLWLPAGTLMEWTTGTRPLRHHCLQFFWPERWYMLSAFYNGCDLLYTYATIILPPTIEVAGVRYVDLDLTMLVRPDLSYEVLTQAEFDHMVELLDYSEETRIGALLALRTLTNAAQIGTGLFRLIPQRLLQTDFHRHDCLSQHGLS
ncbi:DUF402 domain-containing protein [Thermogemmatispora carboxidivorans]|uniref:DUF402 domain-containing protein n=1 Tax=Thermogemmatispora carboxidivorans TaxID=1382306 RepID=UPI00069AF8BC|nr:DUF402 domain-containing protein [Thermogemmatispora carboxidivorans]